MKPESFDEQLSRFDLMCEGDPTFDLSDNDIAALLAVRTEMRIMARSTLASQERIKELEAKLDAKWISVETKPLDNGEVILGNPGWVDSGYYSGDGLWWLTRTDSYDERIQVWPTHWQPLPDPPVQP